MRDFLDGPARSFVVSQGYALWSIIVFAVTWNFSQGTIHDFPTLLAFFTGQPFWFGLFMAAIFGIGPYVRAKQGADKVAAATSLATLVTLPPFPPNTTPPPKAGP